MDWDVFISHASEDKDEVARPLADKFIERGLKVWYDEYTLTVGDSLRRSIDRGLAGSRFGVVILSPHFLQKEWAQKELDGLVASEDGSEKRILPIWHQVSRKDVVSFSPSLADKLGVPTTKGLDHVVNEILRALESHGVKARSIAKKTSPKRQKMPLPIPLEQQPPATWIMLGSEFFSAHSVKKHNDGIFEVTINLTDGSQQAAFESIQKQLLEGRFAAFAVSNDAVYVRLGKHAKEIVGRTSKWTLNLVPDDTHFAKGHFTPVTDAMWGKTFSADDIARLRAGRLLLNKPAIFRHEGVSFYAPLEVALQGPTHYPMANVIRHIFDTHGKKDDWREMARLAAIFELKSTRTVDVIVDLNIGLVRSQKVTVSFRGLRWQESTFLEPSTIEVKGHVDLKSPWSVISVISPFGKIVE